MINIEIMMLKIPMKVCSFCLISMMPAINNIAPVNSMTNGMMTSLLDKKINPAKNITRIGKIILSLFNNMYSPLMMSTSITNIRQTKMAFPMIVFLHVRFGKMRRYKLPMNFEFILLKNL